MDRSEGFWGQYGPYVALGTALAALLGSLYFSEVVGYPPCTLCWWQRILVYPLTVILLVGILKQDEGLAGYVLPFSVAGIGVAGYHYLIQLGAIGQPGACVVGIPCGERYVNYFGFVTIPLLSLAGFAVITGAMALSGWANRHSEGEG